MMTMGWDGMGWGWHMVDPLCKMAGLVFNLLFALSDFNFYFAFSPAHALQIFSFL